MRNPARIDVPEQFLKVHYGPKSNPEGRKKFEAMVKSRREKLKGAPAFDSVQTATKKAVATHKEDDLSIPSVWKEPRDVGKKYTVIKIAQREDAYISGYKEVVDQQEIHDISIGRAGEHRYDDIEEV